MDYLKAKQYLAGIPLPVFFVSVKSGRIVFANNQAVKSGFGNDVSFFQMLEQRAGFSRMVKESGGSANQRNLKLHIAGKLYDAVVLICPAEFGNINCLLISVSSLKEIRREEEAVTITKICDIFTSRLNKESYDFLAVTSQSMGAFCAAIYEKKNNRYVIKEEWRDRKSVCIPLLYTDFEKRTQAEVMRLGKLKRAVDTAYAMYKKSFGTPGAVIYFFDRGVSHKQRNSIEKFVGLYSVLSKDMPKNNKMVIAKKGINAINQAFTVWEPSTRKLLFENKAYRALFGYSNAHELSSSLGINITWASGKTQLENYNDNKGRYYSALHTRTRMNGKEVIVTMVTDITKYKQAENKLDMMANTDALTGLFNRRAGIEYLRQVYTKSKAEKKALTVCFADIDGLKYINDTYGHGAGDSMIKSVAEVLKEHTQRALAAFRLGGDEFVLILPGFNRAQATQLAVLIGKAAAKCMVGESQGISMSFGFKEAEYKPSETAGSLISTADSEMYREKRRKSTDRTM